MDGALERIERLRGLVDCHVQVDGGVKQENVRAVQDAGADLLVVGNRGLNTLSGRLLGSVPSDVARRAGVDVLIVHTT
jgi:nucleotide-binding universal stress UspA family protein